MLTNAGMQMKITTFGFDDIGCNPQYQASQLDKPIPEDDNVCWEIQRFGLTEEGALR